MELFILKCLRCILKVERELMGGEECDSSLRCILISGTRDGVCLSGASAVVFLAIFMGKMAVYLKK